MPVGCERLGIYLVAAAGRPPPGRHEIHPEVTIAPPETPFWNTGTHANRVRERPLLIVTP